MFDLRYLIALGVSLLGTWAQAQTSEQGQTQPAQADAARWSLSAGTAHASSASGDAREQSVSLRRYTELGSVAFERLQLQRFGLQDVAYAIDAYPRLWNGAYANVRVQHAPSQQLYPRSAWRAELYQNVGGGWELAASHDELGFDSHVRIEGVSVGKYWGNFFARWRHQSVRTDVSSGNGDRLFVRYYYEGDADHYVEANASRGRSADFSTAVLEPSRSDSRGLALYHFVTRDWGMKLSWSRSKDSSIAGTTERNASLSMMYRW
jgi:YaiO family outer membrane protein